MRKLALLFMLVWPLQGLAQEPDPAQTERDRSYLTALIEDNLSGEGRQIRLEGFAGALSSRATFEALTIADAEGVWLSLRNGTMSWDRGALLRGRIVVQELSAQEIDLPRPPVPSVSAPSPEAVPFALPELPVSVEIGSVSAQKVTLGAPVLGQEVVFQLQGSLRLAEGEGETQLAVSRTDGAKGQVALKASFANASRQALLDLLVTEGKEGIVAGLIGLPGRPSLTLSASGVGPIDDFTTDILLGTDGAARLTGRLALRNAAAKPGLAASRSFQVDLSGDVSPLLPAEYRDFFGSQSALQAEGRRSASGMLRLERLSLKGQAIAVSGAMDLLPSGLPEHLDLRVNLGLANGQAVVLPLTGPPLSLRKATIGLTFDRATGDGWSLRGEARAVTRAGVAIERLSLEGSGRIGQPEGTTPTVGGTLGFAATGIVLADPAQQEAVGPFLAGSTRFFWQQGKPLSLPDLRITSRDAEVTGRIALADLTSGGTLSGKIEAQHRALQNLSSAAGRTLAGRANASLAGRYTVLSGAFDGEVSVAAQDLRLDQPQADALLAGQARITASAMRDETGLHLRAFEARSDGLSLTASGGLSTAQTALSARFDLPDLSRLGTGYGGAVQATAEVTGAGGRRHLVLAGKGRDLSVAQTEMNRILAGQSLFSATIDEVGQSYRLREMRLETPQLTADVTARDETGTVLAVATRLANAALVAPGFPGPIAVSGTVSDLGGRYGLDLRGTGPGGTEATVRGNLSGDFGTADLVIAGRTETALANGFIAPQSVQGPLAFDLALRGKPGLAALSGQVSGHALRISAPALGQRLEDADLRLSLANGTAQIEAQARFSEGGTVVLSGPVTLAAPHPAQLSLVLEHARLRDPELYDTRISGRLSLSGPLTGAARIAGDLVLDDTELRIPSGGLGGAAAIPEIRHIAEPADVAQTRRRAGLLARDTAKTGGATAAMALDVSVSAPRQIFVRGRGLDAELGGALRLGGTTANVVPVGEFGLIRGRLDVLGKRFTLTEGQVALQGALVPWILFSATTEQDEIAITLAIEGEASEPVLKITSAPELPEEEVLARLLFDKGLSNLSPLQAAQLASAVASLAGKGGEGIVSRLRQGFGLDDLDVGTDASGNATVRAGKYLAENVYTDVAVDSAGKAEVNLNLDISPQLTARGSVGSTGESSLGLFFEKDY